MDDLELSPDIKLTNANAIHTSAVAISQCGVFSAVADIDDNSIRLYNLNNILNKGITDPLQIFVGHAGKIISLKMSEDAKFIVSGGSDRKVIV